MNLLEIERKTERVCERESICNYWTAGVQQFSRLKDFSSSFISFFSFLVHSSRVNSGPKSLLDRRGLLFGPSLKHQKGIQEVVSNCSPKFRFNFL